MPKYITYQVAEHAHAEYISLVEEATALEARTDQPNDPSLIDAFPDLLENVGSFMEYANSSSSDVLPNHELSIVPFHEPSTTAFRDLSTADLAYLQYEPYICRTSADREFVKIAKACMSRLKDDRERSFKPFVPYYQQYMPEALKSVYKHMGYGSIDDAIFIHMAGWYDIFDLDHCWCDSCQSPVERTSIDILISRDVPTAVTYMHRSTNDLVRIEQLAFRNLAEAAEQYLAFTNDFDDWSDEEVTTFRDFSGPIIQWLHYENGIEPIDWMAFKDIAAAVTGHVSYEPPPYFPRFFKLPAELRKAIHHQYLLKERDERRLSRYHHDYHLGGRCCLWDYPNSLTLCNDSERRFFGQPRAASHHEHWLPALALSCEQLLGEVSVHMLEYTARIDLKFICHNDDFNIGTWFHKFLAAIPGGGGLRVVKYLSFPLEHCFRRWPAPLSTRNPTVEFAVACHSLRKINMTVHYPALSSYNHRTTLRTPLPLHRVLDLFALRPLIKCESLRQIYFDGTYDDSLYGGELSHWYVLVAVGKWLIKGLLVEQDCRIQVELCHHLIYSTVRLPGAILTLDEADKKEVDKWRKMKKANSLPAPVQAERDLGVWQSLFHEKM